MVLFFNMLDVAGVAAFIIWISRNPNWFFNDWQGRRQKFLKQLGQELTNDYIQVCTQTQSCLKSNVRNALKMIGELKWWSFPTSTSSRKPPLETLQAVPNTDRQETPGVCNICNRNVCPAHSSKVVMFTCVDCQWNSEHCYQITYLRNWVWNTIWSCISVMVSL